MLTGCATQSQFLRVRQLTSKSQILLVKLYSIWCCARFHPPAGSSPRIKFKPDPVQLLLELCLILRREVLLYQVFMGYLQKHFLNKRLLTLFYFTLFLLPQTVAELWSLAPGTIMMQQTWGEELDLVQQLLQCFLFFGIDAIFRCDVIS